VWTSASVPTTEGVIDTRPGVDESPENLPLTRAG